MLIARLVGIGFFRKRADFLLLIEQILLHFFMFFFEFAATLFSSCQLRLCLIEFFFTALEFLFFFGHALVDYLIDLLAHLLESVDGAFGLQCVVLCDLRFHFEIFLGSGEVLGGYLVRLLQILQLGRRLVEYFFGNFQFFLEVLRALLIVIYSLLLFLDLEFEFATLLSEAIF